METIRLARTALALAGFVGIMYVGACATPDVAEESLGEARQAIGNIDEPCATFKGGNICYEGSVCTGGGSCTCRDLLHDLDNCGYCGHTCHYPAEGGTAVCQRDAPYCDVDCDPGWSKCANSGNPASPYTCRNLNSDPNNCNYCGNTCPAPPANAQSTCSGGTCGFACLSGWGDCTSASGCETDLSTSMSHCGSCGNSCDAAHEVCSSGQCVPKPCTYSGQCGSGYYCGAAGTCVVYATCGSTCPSNTQCCPDTGVCFPAAVDGCYFWGGCTNGTAGGCIHADGTYAGGAQQDCEANPTNHWLACSP